MITAVEIENFKAIRERTRIEIKPITLLFGPNSAGKSTLLHALQLAREIFLRHNLDADVTDGGGGFIDLGGFRNFVHARDANALVTLRFDLDLSDTNFLEEVVLPEYSVPYPIVGGATDISAVGDDIQVGWVEIVFGYFEAGRPPDLWSYTVGIDGEPFARLAGDQLWRLNVHHPLVRWESPSNDSFCIFDHLVPEARPWPHMSFLEGTPVERHELVKPPRNLTVARVEFDEGPEPWELRIGTTFQGEIDGRSAEFELIYARSPDALCVKLWGIRCLKEEWNLRQAKRYLKDFHPPDVFRRGRPLPESLRFRREGYYDDPDWASLDSHVDLLFRNAVENGVPNLDRELDLIQLPMQDPPLDVSPEEWRVRRSVFSKLLTRLLFVPGRLLKRLLTELRYVGPVRDAVPRNFAAPRFADPRRWAGGLAAWEAIERDGGDLVTEVSNWLGREDRLNTGFGVRVEQYREILLGHALSDVLAGEPNSDKLDSDSIAKMYSELPVKKRTVLVSLPTQATMQPADVGQGLTQAVPVVVAALLPFYRGETKARGGLVAIEQPELHLHPAAQTGLGDLFIAGIHRLVGNRFLIETHSEHLLLRLLRRIRQTTEGNLPPGLPSLTTDQFMVLYFEPPSGNSPTKVYQLRVDDRGEFLDPWPRGFFDERSEELFGP